MEQSHDELSFSIHSDILLSSQESVEEIHFSDKFWFPYEKPYDEQKKLIEFVYGWLKNTATSSVKWAKSQSKNKVEQKSVLIDQIAQVSLVESPTGTGKTLSLLWSLLRYYQELRQGTQELDDSRLNKHKMEETKKEEEMDVLELFESNWK